ncbi:NAD(P)H-dependent oxidoreductase [Paenibacillus sp. GCM10027627]|uniref:NAD(P)H-dependent oxidoreductase n=1 Tax=unclassified Paenibacillus TaxID=185978 RepID=UPI00363FB087
MKSNILVLIGHPYPKSFCSALAAAYREGASVTGANIKIIDLSAISFDPNLKNGYHKRTDLEPELMEAQDMVSWADHLVLIYPNWWGTMPAVFKGFFDRVFLPGFAFKMKENSSQWEKLLKGKTARLIVTSDTPSWLNRLIYRRAGLQTMRKNILMFCGINPVRITEINPVTKSTPEQREKWLQRVKQLGEKQA